MLASSWRAPTAGSRVSSRSSCASVSSIWSAKVFSSTRATRRVPGIGAMSSPRVRIHASAVCAGVASISAPIARTSSTRARLRRKLSPVKRGLVLRQSSSAKSVLAHFIVSDDVERSRRFYTEVLGGRVVFSGDVTYVALSNSWIIINVGGGPTDDKPAVTLEPPRDPDRVSSFLNIRVKDIEAVYAEWSARGAQFLTPPKQHQYEIRCYIRDPDGHLIEVGQTTDPEGDWSPARWPSSTADPSCATPPAPPTGPRARPTPPPPPPTPAPAAAAPGS